MKTAVYVCVLILGGCGDDSGSSHSPDGGMNMCAPSDRTGPCTIKPGDQSRLLTGDVLLPGQVLHGGQVLISATGEITCVACDCTAAAAGATQIDCPQGVISPGLINSHDHITYTQNSPAPDSGERYEQRHDWREGLRGHTKIPAPGGASVAQIQWGELRFVMGGATSTVGSGSAPGFLRNLDKTAQEGLTKNPVTFDTFPLGDSNGTQLTSGCAYPSIQSAQGITNDTAYYPHISEGIDAVAYNEFLCTSSSANGGQDLVQPQTAVIHAVGLGARDYAQMAADGTALIWSPRSNVRLYGDTAMAPAAAREGVLVALGTDWILSGSMNLLRELACADQLNSTYYGHSFTDEQLWLMVTRDAATAAAMDDVLGVLETGHQGDVTIFDGSTNKEYRAVIGAQPQDVLLVLRGGKPLYGNADLISGLTSGCDPLDVCGQSKAVCAMGETGMTLNALESAAGVGIYPLFFCGPPVNEPSCTPARMASVAGSTVYTGQPMAGDADGDGIPDAMDNCPMVFNPVRPVDNGMQADADGDGVGDACDPCPLDPNTTQCGNHSALLMAFGPDAQFTREGRMGAPSFPMALTVTLSAPAAMDTTVMIDSNNPSALTAAPVVVPMGMSSAPVQLNALAAAVDVTLTAQLGIDSRDAHVRVLGATEGPTMLTLSPMATEAQVGQMLMFTVGVDLPPPADSDVQLSATSGTVPATVTLPADQLSVMFSYVHASDSTITATLGTLMQSATVTTIDPNHRLVINEIDYDQPGTDSNEFVEIYNGTTAAVDLTNLALVLVNGANNMEYLRFPLAPAASLPSGGYLVVASNTVTVAQGAQVLRFALASNNIQNGPDSIRLLDTSSNQVIDDLSYGGAGQPADSSSVAGAVARHPNGYDADNLSDWQFTATPTPGAPNP